MAKKHRVTKRTVRKTKQKVSRRKNSSQKTRFLIAGNWKMNPESVDLAKSLLRRVTKVADMSSHVEVVFCPPFPFLSLVKPEKNVFLGAQDCYFEDRGPYTGSVSPAMLKSAGCKYVIVGHSERRAAGETNDVVAKKLRAAVRARLNVILCIGETHRDTEGNYLSAIREQLKESLVFTERLMLPNIVIAYEPVWAIGGKVAVASHDIHQAVIFIRKVLTELYTPDLVKSIRILYGGSSNAQNAEDILARGEVDGLLVGGASLEAEDFSEVLRIAHRLKK